ncbi:MFS transporter [Burkholderia stagnalis]|uniref:MFS transporter n=1 Tax=Burkholderia stagnalis TaxID=1503054 RepID=UPI0007C75DDE|nr:MFS transporter [Burkholderia stagnalis]
MSSETVADVFPNRGRTVTLSVLSFAQFMIALDYSIIYVALPEISNGLHIDDSVSQWIVSSYGLLFAGFLLVGGRICDRYGPASAFAVSIAIFGAASLLGGIAPDGTFLLLARAIQGVSAAILQPAIIALIAGNFPEGRERARALSIWGAVGASGLVAGVVLGGLLALVSWRLIFVINGPVALACLLLGQRYFARNTAAPDAARIPLLASLFGTVAVLSFVLWLTLQAEYGWTHPWTRIVFTASVVLLAIFAIAEAKLPLPLIQRDLRAIRSLKLGCAASALYMASVGSEFFLITLLLQKLYGYDVWTTGLLFLPLSITIILGNMLAERILRRYAAGRVLAFGFVLGAAGLLYLALRIGYRDYWLDVFPGLLVSGLGHGIIYTSKFVVGIRGITEQQQGAASSLMVTAQYGSGSIALALLVITLGIGEPAHAYAAAFALTAFFAILGAGVAIRDRSAPAPQEAS